jgi:hypothetical protein
VGLQTARLQVERAESHEHRAKTAIPPTRPSTCTARGEPSPRLVGLLSKLVRGAQRGAADRGTHVRQRVSVRYQSGGAARHSAAPADAGTRDGHTLLHSPPLSVGSAPRHPGSALSPAPTGTDERFSPSRSAAHSHTAPASTSSNGTWCRESDPPAAKASRFTEGANRTGTVKRPAGVAGKACQDVRVDGVGIWEQVGRWRRHRAHSDPSGALRSAWELRAGVQQLLVKEISPGDAPTV